MCYFTDPFNDYQKISLAALNIPIGLNLHNYFTI